MGAVCPIKLTLEPIAKCSVELLLVLVGLAEGGKPKGSRRVVDKEEDGLRYLNILLLFAKLLDCLNHLVFSLLKCLAKIMRS